jgi:MoaA/NifB/PqqE/SkfB family radical SAM enzyme
MFRFFRRHLYVYPRMAWALLASKLFGKAFLRNLVIELTPQCNARCSFCYAEPTFQSSEEAEKRLDPAEVSRLIRWAGKHNVGTVSLSGGETLLAPNLLDHVKLCHDNHVMPVLATNGLLLKPKKTDELRRAGLTVFCCSIHGIGDQHSRVLGIPNSYERIVENLRYAFSVGMIGFCNHVVTKENLADGTTDRVIETFLDLGCAGVNLLPVCANGSDTSTLLDEEELRTYRKYLENPRIRADIKNYFGDPHCPAAWGDAFINYRGEVTPCPFLPIKYGQIQDEGLETILARMRADERFREPAPMCLAGENRAWAEKHLLPVLTGGEVPMDHEVLDGITTPRGRPGSDLET